LAQVQGAFCLLLLTQDSLIGVRDPNGFRPLNLGKVNGSYVLASETVRIRPHWARAMFAKSNRAKLF
jgi:glutamine phosphoribosylpyrophosphate amidotransferase